MATVGENIRKHRKAQGLSVVGLAGKGGMAEGAISALQTAGWNVEGGDKVIPVYGVDAMDSAVQKIDAGIMTGTVKQDGEGMATTIMALVSNVDGDAALMNGIDEANGYNVDKNEDGTVKVAKIRVPYAKVTA